MSLQFVQRHSLVPASLVLQILVLRHRFWGYPRAMNWAPFQSCIFRDVLLHLMRIFHGLSVSCSWCLRIISILFFLLDAISFLPSFLLVQQVSLSEYTEKAKMDTQPPFELEAFNWCVAPSSYLNLISFIPHCLQGILQNRRTKLLKTVKFLLVCLCSWTAYRKSSRTETGILRKWDWNSRSCKTSLNHWKRTSWH